MTDVVIRIAVLLLPVAALLFLNLRFSRKLRYPHNLLQPDQRRGLASLLFKNFRSYYDLLIDALIAVAIAFALFQADPKGRPALVIEATRASLAGFPGTRPLDSALKLAAQDGRLSEAEPFILSFDPKRGKSIVSPIASQIRGLNLEQQARKLESSFEFWSVDPNAVSSLREAGYGKITYITDRERFSPANFGIIATGSKVSFACYPASARRDRTKGYWFVSFAESGLRVPIQVLSRRVKTGQFEAMDSGEYLIEEGSGGRRIRLAAPGLYLFSLRAPDGQVNIDIPLRFYPGGRSITAKGAFSEAMASVLEGDNQANGKAFFLVDLANPRAVEVPNPKKGSVPIRSFLAGRASPFLLDPRSTGGELIAADWFPGIDFSLGPASLANDALPLAYEQALWPEGDAFELSPPPGTKTLLSARSAWLAQGAKEGDDPVALFPPASLFFDTPKQGRITLPPPSSPRPPWLLLFLPLCALKLAAWRKLRGKKLFAKD